MRKHGGTPSRGDKYVTLAAISPPGVAQGRLVGDTQSGLAGCKPPLLLKRGASFCLSQQQRQREPWGASPGSDCTFLPPCSRSETTQSTKGCQSAEAAPEDVGLILLRNYFAPQPCKRALFRHLTKCLLIHAFISLEEANFQKDMCHHRTIQRTTQWKKIKVRECSSTSIT